MQTDAPGRDLERHFGGQAVTAYVEQLEWYWWIGVAGAKLGEFPRGTVAKSTDQGRLVDAESR